VTCVDLNHDSVRVKDTFCNSTIRPGEDENSGMDQCDIHWRTGPWSRVHLKFIVQLIKVYVV